MCSMCLVLIGVVVDWVEQLSREVLTTRDVVQITLQAPLMLHGLSVLIVIYMIYLVFICYCRRFYIR